MYCPKCHEPNPDDTKFCIVCGASMGPTGSTFPKGAVQTEIKRTLPLIRHTVPERYASMRVAVKIYHALSVVLGVVALIIAIVSFQRMGFLGFFVAALIGIIPVIMLYLAGDHIQIVVDTEENTRRSAEYLRQILETKCSELEGGPQNH